MDNEETWRGLCQINNFVRVPEDQTWKNLFRTRKSMLHSKAVSTKISAATFDLAGGIRCLDQADPLVVCGCSWGQVLLAMVEDLDHSRSSELCSTPPFAVLEGHSSWVYSVCIKIENCSGDAIIASGSRDRTVRVCRIARHDYMNIPATKSSRESVSELVPRIRSFANPSAVCLLVSPAAGRGTWPCWICTETG